MENYPYHKHTYQMSLLPLAIYKLPRQVENSMFYFISVYQLS